MLVDRLVDSVRELCVRLSVCAVAKTLIPGGLETSSKRVYS